MEAPDLSSPGYWESETVDVRLNPRRPVDAAGLREFVEEEVGIRSAIVLATSGSSGGAKFVVLPKRAVLASARAVNGHCGLTEDDIWLGGLSTFHVGGIGIHARAICNGARVVPTAWDAWTRDGAAFLEAVVRNRATLTSLTPAHVSDLVQARARCPGSLRGVFLGGGRIRSDLVADARGFGWPLWPTYGMSETASQVATALDGDGTWLPVLPGWETATAADGRLSLRGAALFAGYVVREGGGWAFEGAVDGDGWFTAGDCCELRGGELRFVARADGAVKVLGELVSLPALNDRLAEFGICGWIVALPDPRKESELVLVREGSRGAGLAGFNEGLPPVERIGREVVVEELPRTDLGKPDRAGIEAVVSHGS